MAIVLALGLLLCSCSNDVWTKDIDFPETKGFDDKTVRGVEYGVSYNGHIDKKFFETYPYIDGYQGYYLDENLYFNSIDAYIFGTFYIKRPILDVHIDERMLLYFKYDSEVYPQVKNFFIENCEVADSPVEELNGYVFYDIFLTHGASFPYKFNRIAFNDDSNVVVVLGFYYSDSREIYVNNYTWQEFLDEFYGGWYSFT